MKAKTPPIFSRKKSGSANSAQSVDGMTTREQSSAIKKTVVENAARELVLEHACELVETFPILREKALILSVIRSWDSMDSITKKKVNDRIKAVTAVAWTTPCRKPSEGLLRT